MRRRATKWGVLILCAAAVLVGVTSSTGRAGVIPWLYNAVFGPPGSIAAWRAQRLAYLQSAGYAPAYPAYGYGYGCGTSACAPAVSYYVAPCSPCGISYSPCGPSGCPTGCEVSYASPSPTPADSGTKPKKDSYEEPRTFQNNGTEAPMPDSGFRPRRSGDDAAGAGTPGEEDYSPPETIRRKTPAPTLPPEGTPGEAEGEKSAQREVRPLGLDSRASWQPVRTAPTRWAVRAQFASPVLARSRVDVNRDWSVVQPDTKLAGR